MTLTLDQTLQRLMRPLVRYLITQGVTWGAFASLVKSVYIEEAVAHAQPRVPSDSEVSLLTGIHRKDVRRLRDQDAGPAPNLERHAHVAAQLIAAWASSPEARDAHGALKPLPIHSATELSFDGLTRHVKADMRPRAILDALVRARAVTLDDNRRVHLVRSAYVPDSPADKLAFLALNVGDHLASALHNLSEEPPFLERALYLDALNPETIQGVRPDIDAAADALLQDFHRRLSPHERPVTDPGVRRVRLGVYYYEDTPLSAPEDSHEDM